MSPPLTGGIKCDNEHCEWQWRGSFPSLQTLGGSRCLSDEWTAASAPHERQKKWRRGRKWGLGGGWGGAVVHLRLIKRSEASRRLWSRLIKALKGGMWRAVYASFVLFFFSRTWSLERHIKWKQRHEWPERLISHKAQFPCFILADGRRLLPPFSGASHDYTAFFPRCCSGLCWTSVAPFTHSDAHWPLFSAAHSSQKPKREIRHNYPEIDFFSVSTRWPCWMWYIFVAFNLAWKTSSEWFFFYIFGILGKANMQQTGSSSDLIEVKWNKVPR